MERDSIRKIVLAEIALFKGKNFDSEEGSGPISKLETLEVLTRPEVYNASPDAIQKSIDNEFKEVAGFNSSIAASLLMGLGVSCGCGCCDEEEEENPFEELVFLLITPPLLDWEKKPRWARLSKNLKKVLLIKIQQPLRRDWKCSKA